MSSTVSGPKSFADLQASLVDRLGRRGVSELAAGTLVVLPSITFPTDELVKIVGIERYEERMLCMLVLLDRPALRIVYVTSAPVDPAVVDYYLSFTPDPAAARERLDLVSIGDPAPRALSEKLLEHPSVLDEVTARIPDPSEALLFPFNVTDLEREISERLELPLYGPDPDLVALGSKSGGRQVARIAGVPVPPGAEDLWSLEEVEAEALRLVREVPDLQAIVIKLNNGFSGQGNVIVERDAIKSPLQSSTVTFCAEEESWESFAPKIAREGAIVEELVRAPGLVSPSVQLRAFPGGEFEVVSTHDQILGGPDDQVYLGCRFPARDEYRALIQAYGLGIAGELASRGVIGSFGVDFIVHPDGRVFMSEINLRLGGTTHPFLMARFVTGGKYDIGSGELRVAGDKRVYVGTDNIKSPKLIGRNPADLIGTVVDAGLAFDAGSNTGVTLHLLGATHAYGKLGAVCIAEDHDRARAMYEQLLDLLGVEPA